MRYLKIMFLILVCISSLFSDIRAPKLRFRAGFKLVDGIPGYNQEFTLRLWVKCLHDAPNTVIKIKPGNHKIRILSGDTLQSLSLSKGDSVSFDLKFKISRVGFYAISAVVSDTTDGFWPSYASQKSFSVFYTSLTNFKFYSIIFSPSKRSLRDERV